MNEVLNNLLFMIMLVVTYIVVTWVVKTVIVKGFDKQVSLKKSHQIAVPVFITATVLLMMWTHPHPDKSRGVTMPPAKVDQSVVEMEPVEHTLEEAHKKVKVSAVEDANAALQEASILFGNNQK